MDHPHPMGTPIRARHSLTFMPGPNLFNHSTIGKIIRFESDDYGFICLQCGSNYSASEQFLAHIETHFQINAPDALQQNEHEESILPHALDVTIGEPIYSNADCTVPNSNERSDATPPPNAKTVSAEPIRKSTRIRRPAKKFAPDGLHQCSLCSYNCCADLDLRRHKMRDHKNILSKIKIKDYSCFCSLCGEEFGIKKFKAAEKHMKKHVDKGDF